MHRLTVKVPATPASELSPNRLRRVSGWKRQEVVGALKNATLLVARPVAPPSPVTGPVALHVTIAWEKGRKVQDFDGAVGSCKPLIDGLAQAGWMANDRQVVAMEVLQTRDPEGLGYTLVSMIEREAA